MSDMFIYCGPGNYACKVEFLQKVLATGRLPRDAIGSSWSDEIAGLKNENLAQYFTNNTLKFSKQTEHEYFSNNVSLAGIPCQCGCALAYSWNCIGFNNPLWTPFLTTLEEALRHFGYSKVMATLTAYQWSNYQPFLEPNGWKRVDEFDNRRSGNHNYILTKEIPAEAAK